MKHFQWQDEKLTLYCHVQPGADRSEFSGLHGDRIKLRLKAPATDGKANIELIAFLSKSFGVAKNQIGLDKGTTSRQKSVSIFAPKRLPSEALISA